MVLPLLQRAGCVESLVDRHVRAGRGERTALIECSSEGRRSLSYAQLAAATIRLAGELDVELGGCRAQQRIAIVGSSTLETLCIWLAAMRAGHLPFLVHPDLGDDAYDLLFSDFDPARVFRDRTARVRHGLDLRPVDEAGLERREVAAACMAIRREPGADTDTGPDLRAAFCLASSGSTGRPKICVHSHHAVASFERHVTGPMWRLRDDDIVLGTSGPYFSFGLQGIHPALSIGATSVLLPGWQSHDEFLAAIEAERVSVFLAVPTLYHLLMARAKRPFRLDSLRLCLAAGERLPAVVRERWEAFSRAPMLDSIGTTETFLPYLSEVAGVASGLREVAAFGYEWTAAGGDPDTGAYGSAGALDDASVLRVTGDALMLGCFRPGESAAYQPQGPTFDPGDLFARAGDGWRFLSRRSERTKVAGHWVSPQDLEEFLLADPRVVKAAALPVETPEGLVRLRAFIVLDVPEYCAAHIVDDMIRRIQRELKPGALRPDRIEVVRDLQSTPSGKLRREALHVAPQNGTGCVLSGPRR
ncbi:AMP-binding protein [Paraburkholderia phytofirmans]|nr:AMP-binding protein [Paraburkholderia phytofirmans]